MVYGNDCTILFSLVLAAIASTCDACKVWRKCTELERELPAPWKIKSDVYKNKVLEAQCYEMLVIKIK